MRIPPKTPHFFKPLLPGFENGIAIPEAFLDFLKGVECDHAVLRRCGGGAEWPVKINGGRRLEDGWRKFAEDNDLHVGDFGVFRHVGNMVFQVSIFDSSGCERKFSACDVGEVGPTEAEYVVETTNPSKTANSGLVDELNLEGNHSEPFMGTKRSSEDVDEGSNLQKKFSKLTSLGEEGILSSETDGSEEPNKASETHSETKETCFEVPDHPYFESTVKPYNIKWPYLFVPMEFARSNGLDKCYCKMIIKNSQHKSWPVELVRGHHNITIRRGWRKFFYANGLKVGDTFKLELIEGGKRPVMQFQAGGMLNHEGEPSEVTDLKENSTSPSLAVAEGLKEPNNASAVHLGEKTGFSEVPAYPSFVSKVKRYNIKWRSLILPKEFARSNGLNKSCDDMIIKDSQQRSWHVKLLAQNSSGSVYMKYKWREFFNANDVKVGDTFRCELIRNGNKPIMQFHVVEKLNSKGDHSMPRTGTKRSFAAIDEGSNFQKKYSKVTELGEMDTLSSSLTDRSKEPNKALETDLETKATYAEVPDHPYFESKVRPYNIKWPYLVVPMEFARSNGLDNRYCKIIIKNSQHKSWPVELVPGVYSVTLRHGWCKFFHANGLKVGDTFKLELLKGGKNPVMQYHGKPSEITDLREKGIPPSLAVAEKGPNNASTVHFKAKADFSEARNHPSFEFKVKHYNIRWRYLVLPKEFARSNGLNKRFRDIILIDEQQRSWCAKLEVKNNSRTVYISHGWCQFFKANGLQVGDTFKCELIRNGSKPTMQFHVIQRSGIKANNEASQSRAGKALPDDQSQLNHRSSMSFADGKHNLSEFGDKSSEEKQPESPVEEMVYLSNDSHPSFNIILKHSHAKYGHFYIPLQFARLNGLNKRCHMILRDLEQRSWSVELVSTASHVYMRGASEMVFPAHSLKLGDTLKFELVEKGKKPVMIFYGIPSDNGEELKGGD